MEPSREEIVAKIRQLNRDVKEIWEEIDKIWLEIKRIPSAKQPRSRPRRHSGRAYY